MRVARSVNRTTTGFGPSKQQELENFLNFFVNERAVMSSHNTSGDVRRTVVSKGAISKPGPLSMSNGRLSRERYTSS